MQRRNTKSMEKPEPRRITKWELTILIALLVVVVGVVAGVILSSLGLLETSSHKKKMAPDSGHFQSEDEPELSKEGVKCVITEAYYTNDGTLTLKLKMSNGKAADQRLLTLDVTLKNEDEETIAVAGTDSIDKNFFVPAGDTATMTYYIPAEYVKISDDDLDSLTYEITTRSENKDGSTDADSSTASTTGTSAAASDTTTTE